MSINKYSITNVSKGQPNGYQLNIKAWDVIAENSIIGPNGPLEFNYSVQDPINSNINIYGLTKSTDPSNSLIEVDDHNINITCKNNDLTISENIVISNLPQQNIGGITNTSVSLGNEDVKIKAIDKANPNVSGSLELGQSRFRSIISDLSSDLSSLELDNNYFNVSLPPLSSGPLDFSLNGTSGNPIANITCGSTGSDYSQLKIEENEINLLTRYGGNDHGLQIQNDNTFIKNVPSLNFENLLTINPSTGQLGRRNGIYTDYKIVSDNTTLQVDFTGFPTGPLSGFSILSIYGSCGSSDSNFIDGIRLRLNGGAGTYNSFLLTAIDGVVDTESVIGVSSLKVGLCNAGTSHSSISSFNITIPFYNLSTRHSLKATSGGFSDTSASHMFTTTSTAMWDHLDSIASIRIELENGPFFTEGSQFYLRLE